MITYYRCEICGVLHPADWDGDCWLAAPSTYIIVNATGPLLYWSNGHGWTKEYCDTFTGNERCKLELPMGGEWLALSS